MYTKLQEDISTMYIVTHMVQYSLKENICPMTMNKDKEIQIHEIHQIHPNPVSP